MKNNIEKFFENWEKEHKIKVSEYPMSFARDYAKHYHEQQVKNYENKQNEPIN